MKIDGEGVKLAFYGVAAIAVFALGYSVYQKMNGLAKDASEAANKARATGERILIGLGETGKEIGAAVDGAISSAKQAIGLPANDYKMPSEYGAYVLNRSQWPSSTVAFIDAANRARKETGYSGWTVYSDGTIISPYKEYLKDNVSDETQNINVLEIGRATSTGFLSSNVNSDNYDMFAANFNSVGSLSNVDKIPY